MRSQSEKSECEVITEKAGTALGSYSSASSAMVATSVPLTCLLVLFR